MRPWLYNTLYRLGIAPWDTGVRPHLVDLVESGRIKPEGGGRVLDLGCGTGAESVYLAGRGFDVVGVDYARVALDRARARARQEGAEDRCRFVRADITSYPLPGVDGTFDVILDFGALDDMTGQPRADMARLIHRYAHPGTVFVLWCFYARKEDVPRVKFAGVSQLHSMIEPGEEQRLFGDGFAVERVESPEHTACFVMTKR
ncbi:class I SAM-dependent methyltransferase [Streptomyces sp. NPDC006997]|uniref:class I SAM-dependent methyltransferase n=1 Tax=Streptomyces sp. NPDC006997 TaxID=3155356 RepID=UPI0033C73851